MARFSERYGYVKPTDALIRNTITDAIENAICSCFDLLKHALRELEPPYGYSEDTYKDMDLYLWVKFLNERYDDFYGDRSYHIVATWVMKQKGYEWYEKLDMVEIAYQWLLEHKGNESSYAPLIDAFAQRLNIEFERLNYAYRIVDKEIVELTNDQEIKAIEECLAASTNNVRKHLSDALELLAERPTGKYCNSIKESISAVEVVCRNLTGENTLGRALDCLGKKGIVIPQVLKNAFNKLYDYTNDKNTGIRHALMDESGGYTPSYAEALFMLVSCSAFINYLHAKEV